MVQIARGGGGDERRAVRPRVTGHDACRRGRAATDDGVGSAENATRANERVECADARARTNAAAHARDAREGARTRGEAGPFGTARARGCARAETGIARKRSPHVEKMTRGRADS